MSRAAFAGLGLVAAALAGAIALELRGIEGDEVTSGAAAAAVARWRPAPSVPTPPSPDRSREWAATALARPLFAADRRPVPEPRAAVAAGGTGGRDLPRLAGVLVAPSGRAAIFAPAGDGAKPLVLRIGDALGEFEVKAIVAGEVTLTGPEGDRVVRPSFDPRGGSGGTPRPTPPAAAVPAPPAAPAGFVPAAAPGGTPVQLPPGFPLGSPAR